MKSSTRILLISIFFVFNVLLLNGQTTYTSASSGKWSDGTTWVGGVVPGPNDNAIISSGTTVSLDKPNQTINDLTIQTGAVVNGENRILTVNGTFLINGTYTSKNAAAKDLNFNGDTLAGSGSIIIDFSNNDFVVGENAVILSSSDLKVYGNVLLDNSVTVTNKGDIEVTGNIEGNNATTSVWTNHDNSYLIIGNSLLSTGILNADSPGNTVEYNNLGDQDIKLPSSSIYYNLNIKGAGNKNLLGAIVLDGDILINNSGILQSNNFNIEIKGDWTNYSDFVPGTATVFFTGSANQLIDNPMVEDFYNFEINKSAGEIIMENDVVINNTLRMVDGIINASGNILTLGFGIGAGETGTLSYFDGYIKGKFERWLNTLGSHQFPVGFSNAQKLWITFSGLDSGGTLITEFIASDPGNNGLSLDDAGTTIYNTFVEGYWTIDTGNGFILGGANNYDLQLSGLGFTSFAIDADTRVLTRTDETDTWTAEGSHQAGIGVTAKRSTLTTLPAHYALGDDTDCVRPITSAISGTGEVCSGQTGVEYSVTDNPPNTYEWTIVGGVQSSGTNTNSITVNWDPVGRDDASVTVVETNNCTNGAPVVLPVTIHSVPPEAITGKTSVAEYSAGVTYSVPARSGYSYQWSVTGGSQVSGDNTNSITVDWGVAGTGSVSVVAELAGCPQAPAVELEVRLYDVIESVQTGDWDDPDTWDCGCVPLSTQSVRINDGHTVTFHNSNDIEINNFIIELGGVLDYNGRPFKVHGDFIINGAYQGGSDKVLTLDGIDAEIGGIGVVEGGFTIPSGNKSISSTSVLSINGGDIDIGTSVFVTNFGNIIVDGNITGVDATSTWVNSDNSTLEISGELLTTGTLRAFANGNVVDYNGVDQAIKTPVNSIYHDLSSSGSGIKTMSNSLIIEGDLFLNGTSTLDVSANNYSINIAGNWTNNGASFQARNSIVTFDGTGDQLITGIESYYDLVYSNSGGDLSMTDDVLVENNLQMAGRNINPGSSILTIGTDATNTGSLTYVSGIVTGKIERWINSFGNTLYPVGVEGSYNPVQLYVNTLNTPGSVIGEFIQADPGSDGLPVVDGTTTISYQFTDGYWNFIASNGFDVVNYDLDLQASNFTRYPLNINTRILKRTDNLNWSLDGDQVTAVPPNIYRDNLVNGISTLGTQFGLGFACAPHTFDAIITNASCFGEDDGAIDITPSGGVNPYTFSWSGGQTTEDISGLTAGSYGVTVTDSLMCKTSAIFSVSQPSELVVDYIVTDVSCPGDSDGEINISVSGGTSPYLYGWSTSDGSGLSPSDKDQTGLSEGTYSVLVYDANGCSVTKDIIVAVGDDTPPSIVCPGNLSAICDISEQPAYLTYADFVAAGGTASDNCDIDTDSFIMLSEISDGNTCPETVTRTYQISDINGNSQTCEQTIIIDDTVDPTASNPAPISVECVSDVPAPDISVVTDAADNCTLAPTVAFVSDVSDGNTCPEVITRTYSVTDDCGNSINVAQTITVDDDVAPVFDVIPGDLTAECDISEQPAYADYAEFTAAGGSVTDNCGVDATSFTLVSEVSDGSSCPETVTRTYRISDDCGNTADYVQTITIEDDTDPVFDAVPGDLTAECDISEQPAYADYAEFTAAGGNVSDNCSVDATSFTLVSEISDGSSCPETVTRTYRISDDCGNTADYVQTITVDDESAPVITGSLTDDTVEGCDATDVPAEATTVAELEAMGVTIDDNCSVDANITVSSVDSESGSCPLMITRTYTVTDECGNSSTIDHIIYIEDTTNPTLTAPSDISVECLSDVPSPYANYVQWISAGGAANDNCGINTASFTFVSQSSDGLSCPETITRIYQIEDNCGNIGTVAQSIIVNDITPPTLTSPAPLSFECTSDIDAPYVSVPAFELAGGTVDDNCGVNNSSFTWLGDASDGNTCPETITRTYEVADNCGNTSQITQTITVNDVTAPTVAGSLTDATVEGCSAADAPAAETTVAGLETLPGGITIDDNCSLDGDITVSNVDISSGSCPVEVTRTYTLTDECGNSETVVHTIYVDDNILPVFDAVPGDLTAECDISEQPAYSDYAEFTAAGGNVTDNCSVDPTSFTLVSEVSDGSSCPETVTRTYRISDDCGNTADYVQTISIEDVTDPVFDAVPGDLTAECDISEQPAYADYAEFTAAGGSVTDNCGIDATSFTLLSEVSDGGSCPETVTRTYRISDDCGNTADYVQTISIEDVTDPVFDAVPGDLTAECDISEQPAYADYDEFTAAGGNVTDNCSLDPASFTLVSEVSDGSSCPETVT
ncbi:MAG: hypothetical protein R6V34_04365, partial [Bacteroidales bacterium]